jgi:uncharacterized protein (UPF0548 family)
MFSVRKQSVEKLRRVLSAQVGAEFTYSGVGATAGGGALPARYVVDHTRVELGVGPGVFERGRAALARWEQFRLRWLEVFPTDAPIRAGETVVVVARAFGVWCTNAARIVYTIDDRGDASSGAAAARFGFAYGTLPDHVESGEERFLVEWDRGTDRVWFEILAFSRPRHFLARLGGRPMRAMQKRFGAEAAAAMQRAGKSKI